MLPGGYIVKHRPKYKSDNVEEVEEEGEGRIKSIGVTFVIPMCSAIAKPSVRRPIIQLPVSNYVVTSLCILISYLCKVRACFTSIRGDMQFRIILKRLHLAV